MYLQLRLLFILGVAAGASLRGSKVFKQLDTNENGALEKAEFAEMVVNDPHYNEEPDFGSMKDTWVRRWFEAGDKSGEGLISLEEFLVVWICYPSRDLNCLRGSVETVKPVEPFEVKFNELNKNRDDHLNLTEFLAWVYNDPSYKFKSLLYKNIWGKKFFKSEDDRNDGKVTLEEFKRLYKSYMSGDTRFLR